MKRARDRALNLLTALAVGAALYFAGRGPSSVPAADFPLPVADAPTAAPAPVADYRERRKEEREREEDALKALADGKETSPETRTDAETRLLQMQENRETELAVEAALAARGYGDALCVARQGAVTVLINGEIREQDAALILYLAQEAAGTDAENIRISGY